MTEDIADVLTRVAKRRGIGGMDATASMQLIEDITRLLAIMEGVVALKKSYKAFLHVNELAELLEGDGD